MLPPRHDSSRSEMLALCMVLELPPDASYEPPVPQHRVRTPDWLLRLPDGRDVALEVTSKKTALNYEDWDAGDGTTILVGSRTKNWTTGDTRDLRRTLYRKMKDKAERGQLRGVLAERWLAIQLDDDAGSELESLFQPVPRIAIDVATRKAVDAYSFAVIPDFGDIMEQAGRSAMTKCGHHRGRDGSVVLSLAPIESVPPPGTHSPRRSTHPSLHSALSGASADGSGADWFPQLTTSTATTAQMSLGMDAPFGASGAL